jgi:hypothetical protein
VRPSTQVGDQQCAVGQRGRDGHNVRPRIVPDRHQVGKAVPRQGFRQLLRYLDAHPRTVRVKPSRDTVHGPRSRHLNVRAGKVAVPRQQTD